MTSGRLGAVAGVGLAALAVALTGCSGAGSAPNAAVTGGAELAPAPTSQPSSGQPSGVQPSSRQPSSAQPSRAASSAAPAVPTSQAAATTGSRTPGAVFDVDGDGVADSVTIRFVGKHSAVVVIRLGTGKSLTSKAFQLFPGDGAGTTSGFDVNGDHRSEVFVEAPGADGVGFDLFSYTGSAIVAVPPPKGQAVPYLYIGGGRYYESTFRCTGDHLVQVKEQPAVANTATLPADPPYRVTTTTWALAGGRLTMTASHTVRAADHAAAQRLLAGAFDGCGTTR
jgi:hypothetical protein